MAGGGGNAGEVYFCGTSTYTANSLYFSYVVIKDWGNENISHHQHTESVVEQTVPAGCGHMTEERIY